jgi:drug/metabolite transporter (DMT)-like permease
MAAVNIPYMFAISRIQVAAAILLEYLCPVFIAAYCVVFAREGIRPVTIAAMVLALAGCFFVAGAYNLNLTSHSSPSEIRILLRTGVTPRYRGLAHRQKLHSVLTSRRHLPWGHT